MRLRPAQAKALGIDIGHAPRGNKFGAVKTRGFDSGREARRYEALAWLQELGMIRDLRKQPEYHVWIHGQLVCRYVADFLYRLDGTEAWVTEDCKGFRTRDYRLKKKLVEAVFGVQIIES